MTGKQARDCTPIQFVDVLPGIDPAEIPQALADKYQLKDVRELTYAFELLDGLNITNGSDETVSDMSRRRREMREAVTAMKSDAAIALSALERLQVNSVKFFDAVGRHKPSGSLLRTLFETPINSVDAPDQYYDIASFALAESDRLDPLMSDLRRMNEMVINSDNVTGKMANERLWTALRVCFVYIVRIEKREWGNAGLRKADVRKFNLRSALTSDAERIATDMLMISGFRDDFTSINSMWKKVQAWGNRGRGSLG